MALYHTDDSSEFDSQVQLIEETDLILGGNTGPDNRSSKTLADRTAYLKKNKSVLFSGSGAPDSDTVSSVTLDSNNLNNTFYIDESSKKIYKLTSISPVTWTEKLQSTASILEEVTSTTKTIEAFYDYIANNTSKIEFTIPTTLSEGDKFSIIGKGTGGWKLKGNHIYIGYKKDLLSYLYSDSVSYIITNVNGNILTFTSLGNNRNFNEIPYGFYGGGNGPLDVIDYIDTTLNIGNATDRGNLSVSRSGLSGISGIQYGFYGGGDDEIDPLNVIDYIDNTLITGNAADRGDLTVARYSLTGISGIQYGFFGGGNSGSSSDVIDYIDNTLITGNAADRGDLTVARYELTGISGNTYGFFGGGYTGSYSDVIDYIDNTLITGNATDRGDLTVARRYLGGVSGIQYGFFGGGYTGSYSDVIDYIDNTLITGNATDRGDLTVARYTLAGVSGIQYGFFGGGGTGSNSDVIDYIDTTLTSGNAIDRGNLTVARIDLAGV